MTKTKIFSLTFILLTIFSMLYVKSVHAARKRVRKAKSGGGQAAYTARGVGISVRFKPNRLGLLLTFSNFDNIESGRYELLYEAGGITQAAGGTILIGDNNTKELLFATCSHGVCTFHENIQNARLSIISKLKNGQTVLKPFRIKV